MALGIGRNQRRALHIASLAGITAYFVISAVGGLDAYFTQDDGGNLLQMHKYWETSLGSVAGAALRVVTPVYRPMGGIYYLSLYRIAGFHPLPFRAVCLALMLVNLYLAFAVFRRLDGSLPEALFATVLIACHPALLWLFYSSGMIYEILCFFFYFLAVLAYFHWREARRQFGHASLSWWQSIVVLALAGAALDSKEMAMTLPAALLLIEILYFPPPSWQWRNGVRFAVTQGRAALTTGVLTLAAVAAKRLTRNPLTDDPRYKVESMRAAFETMGAFHGHLLYRDLFSGALSIGALFLLWAAMALAAFALRSRAMAFGLAFLIVSLVPVCLIQPRGGYMLYLPLAGWALYLASLLGWLCAWLIHLGRFRPRTSVAVQCLVFGGAIAVTMGVHADALAPSVATVREEQALSRRVIELLQEQDPRLERASSLLFVNDPLPPGYLLLFLTRIAYGDPTLEVNRVQTSGPAPGGAPTYDHVLYYEGGRFRDLTPPPIHVQISPARVRAGESYTVVIPDHANQTVDVVVRQVKGVTSSRAQIREWCTLDSAGGGTLAVPRDLAPESIYIAYIRTPGSDWIRADGQLEVTR